MGEAQFVEEDGADFLLRLFVQVAQESAGYEIGITLTVRGVVMTGVLVGRDVWAEELAVLTGAGSVPQTTGSVVGEIVQRAVQVPKQASDGEGRYGYIHLRDARIMAGPASLPTTGGMLWRGRLSEVSGWSIGTLGVTSAP